MTWEQAVERLRQDTDNAYIAEEAYLSKDLKKNADRFRDSDEFRETLLLIQQAGGIKNFRGLKLLDIGAGNGISSLAFASQGFVVTALEPDDSDQVGNGAIAALQTEMHLDSLNIVDAFGENLPFNDNDFSVVYGRQVMHHAHHLHDFVAEAFRVLKPGGVFITVRDHVVNNEKQKKIFLNNHPLHKYYGGENAFTLNEYQNAFTAAGFTIKKVLRPSDSPINYEPWTKQRLINKFTFLKYSTVLTNIFWKLLMYRLDRMAGRLYSIVAIKQ